MNKDQLFAHRPPSAGIHLLSDPFPERVQSAAALRSADMPLISTKRTGNQAKAKKSGLRS